MNESYIITHKIKNMFYDFYFFKLIDVICDMYIYINMYIYICIQRSLTKPNTNILSWFNE